MLFTLHLATPSETEPLVKRVLFRDMEAPVDITVTFAKRLGPSDVGYRQFLNCMLKSCMERMNLVRWRREFCDPEVLLLTLT